MNLYTETQLFALNEVKGRGKVCHQISHHPSEQSVLSLNISFLSISCIPLFIQFFISPSIPFEHIPDKFSYLSVLLSLLTFNVFF